jgi:hypothetical protein
MLLEGVEPPKLFRHMFLSRTGKVRPVGLMKLYISVELCITHDLFGCQQKGIFLEKTESLPLSPVIMSYFCRIEMFHFGRNANTGLNLFLDNETRLEISICHMTYEDRAGLFDPCIRKR